MVTRLTKAKTKFEIDKLLSAGLRSDEIQKQLGISQKKYYRYVKELHNEMYTEDALAQHDKEINSRWNRLDRIIAMDLEKTKDDPIGRAKVLSNAVKINKEKTEYYLKTGKLRDKPQEINIKHSGDINAEMKVLEKYLKDDKSE